MSTTAPMPPWCVGLIDDAAVFPPGLSPVDRAWADHRVLLSGAYAECVGPLLVAPQHVHELSRAAVGGRDGTPPMPVVLIGRAGTSVGELAPAIASLAAVPAVRLSGLEVAHASGWQTALQHALPLAVEVPRLADDRDRALDELAEARADGPAVTAKLRTQETAEAPVPTASALAGFIMAAGQRDLPFKLTGGLHRAIATSSTTPHAAREHGVVNVLLATHAALTGAQSAEVAQLLVRSDSRALAEELGELLPTEQHELRATFTSYGCCGVLDPLVELADLGLLPTAASAEP